MKPFEIKIGTEEFQRQEYSCLFADADSNIPQFIQSTSRESVLRLLDSPQTQRVLLNCNRDVILVVQKTSPKIPGSYQWERFNSDSLGLLESQKMYPVAISNSQSGEPLFLATVTGETIRMSLETGNLIMWSKSRNKLWIKGDTSGDYLKLRELYWDPDKQVFFAKVFPETGGVCHEKIDSLGNPDENGTAAKTCFRRVIFER